MWEYGMPPISDGLVYVGAGAAKRCSWIMEKQVVVADKYIQGEDWASWFCDKGFTKIAYSIILFLSLQSHYHKLKIMDASPI